MSRQAVRKFYKTLSDSPEMAARYKLLARRWPFGYNAKRVVAFAEQAGFPFTEEDLQFVRLTNDESQSLGRRYFFDDVDLNPTERPHPPVAPHTFSKEHGRDPG